MDDATRAQVRAARPDASTWVAANAGSGKTRVLTDRVARLLLRGTDPRRILCLTFTKAAAAEMQNRLFARLGEWAMLDDVTLRARMAALDEAETVIPAQGLAQARTLFARALETPGGLKIQTIHGFCDGLLRRFPLEAGVSPQFAVMEERQAQTLRARVLEASAADPAAGFGDLAPHIISAEYGLDTLMAEISGHRDRLAREPDAATLWQALGASATPPPGPMAGVDADQLATVVAAIGAVGGQTEAGFLPALQGLLAGSNDAADLAEQVLLTAKGTVRKTGMGTKKVEAMAPGTKALLTDISERLAEIRDHRMAGKVVRGTLALTRFARHWLTAYEAEKQALGLLDFDDLIGRTRALLTQAEAADWVRYKLDGGIDHLLVDEAQDTSPAQWAVINALAQEFFAGGSDFPRPRSLFVVGDEKQSIYSFQGADPAGFGAQRDRYRGVLADVNQALEVCDLAYSFRSSDRVLRAVDQVFSARAPAEGGAGAAHRAFHADMPGRVELWPFVEAGDEGDPGVWYQPVDMKPAAEPEADLAAQVTARIADLLAQGVALPGTDRPVNAGDFLILVRSRGRLFRALLKHLKASGVPVAGADRLKLGQQLAVRDILALLQVIATPQDDLSMAAALRSPLFEVSEAALYGLAKGRKGTLLQAVLDAPDQTAAAAVLADLRGRADYLRPFELIDRLLTRHKARARLRDRLGVEAEEAVDALMTLALDYEQTEAPSLTGFLEWMNATDAEVKRQLDTASGEVRIMTVHGAKGLEAPIVILPDTLPPRGGHGSGRMMAVGADMVVLRPTADDMPATLGAAAEIAKERDAEESWRLLYVAMTRAERWLIVCGAGARNKAGAVPEGWYTAVDAALADLGAEADAAGGRIWSDDWQMRPAAQVTALQTGVVQRPDWLDNPAPTPKPVPKPIAPSRDGALYARGPRIVAPPAGLDPEAAALRGRRLHLLLEKLPDMPPSDWPQAAQGLLADGPDAVPDDADLVAALLDAARQVIEAPDLAWIFAPGAGTRILTEVPVAGRVAALGDSVLRGQIDRLLVSDTGIWAIDFKTSEAPPPPGTPLPAGIRGQMALYHAALSQIFDRPLRLGVLWTDTGDLTEVTGADLVPVPQQEPVNRV